LTPGPVKGHCPKVSTGPKIDQQVNRRCAALSSNSLVCLPVESQRRAGIDDKGFSGMENYGAPGEITSGLRPLAPRLRSGSLLWAIAIAAARRCRRIPLFVRREFELRRSNSKNQ